MLRIAVLKKEMGAIDQSMQMCNTITSEPFGDSIRANALCLKVVYRADSIYVLFNALIAAGCGAVYVKSHRACCMR